MAGGKRTGSVSFKFDDIHESVTKLDLVKIVQCSNCREIPIRPIFTCSSGHIICSSCRNFNPRCGKCSASVTDTRNQVAESIVMSFVFKCKFRIEGCKKLIPWDDILRHLNVECEYRPIVCNEALKSACEGIPILYSSYINHLKDVHTIRKFRLTEKLTRSIHCNSISQNCNWPLFCIESDDGVFFQHIQLENSVAYIWITSFGPFQRGRFTATITMKKQQPEMMEVTTFIPVQGFRSTFEEIKRDGYFAALQKEQLMALSVENMRDDQNKQVYKYGWIISINICKT